MGSPAEKVIITNAISGALASRSQCPAIPYTPEEYAAEARRCAQAGASVVHIHARERDGRPTFRWEMYREIRDAILSECDILINFSTGGPGNPRDRVAHVTRLTPDIGALNMGSMNYAKYSSRRQKFVFDLVFQNPFRDILFYLKEMKAAGVKPELECFDLGHTNSIEPLLEMGALEEPIQFSFIMGVLGGICATAENLAAQVRQIPRGSTWEVIGISLDQWPLLAAALALGGNVRVGLEDNFYVSKGQMAKSNADLVEKAARMARDVGREPATAAEAAQLLSLDHCKPEPNFAERAKGTLPTGDEATNEAGTSA